MSDVDALREFNGILASASGRMNMARGGLERMADSLLTHAQTLAATLTPSLAALETELGDALDGHLAPLGHLATAARNAADDLDAMDRDVHTATDDFESDASAVGARFKDSVEAFIDGSTATEAALSSAETGFAELGTAVEQGFALVSEECVPQVLELATALREAAEQASGAAADAEGSREELAEATRAHIGAICGASASLQVNHNDVREDLRRFQATASEQALNAMAALAEGLEGILGSGTEQAEGALARIDGGLEPFVNEGLLPFVAELDAWSQGLDGAAEHWEGLRDQVAELKSVGEVVAHIQQMLAAMGG